MKTGLVLEGGAMRGLFTAGVTDILMEEGLAFDGAIGVSAGAAFGCNVKSKQIGRALRYNTTYCNDPRYCSFRSLIKTGDLYGAEFCYSTIPYELDPFDVETYNQNPMDFYVVCTDVETGKPVYQNCPVSNAESMQWFRASASMPLVSRIVEVGGYRLLDGGVSDSIPLEYFESIGYQRNLVILTQPEGYRKQPNKAMPLMRLMLGKYPNLLGTMAERHNIYNAQLAYVQKREEAGAALVLRPETPLPVSRTEHDPEKLREAYRQGQACARKNLKRIRAFLQQPAT
ncbi:MAG: patatin family protein [Clostridiales bacterium]|nr:patatin family protein [Clostridiales bacterium]